MATKETKPDVKPADEVQTAQALEGSETAVPAPGAEGWALEHHIDGGKEVVAWFAHEGHAREYFAEKARYCMAYESYVLLEAGQVQAQVLEGGSTKPFDGTVETIVPAGGEQGGLAKGEGTAFEDATA